MADAKQCDRCKGFYLSSEYQKIINGFTSGYEEDPHNLLLCLGHYDAELHLYRYDLCPKCLGELKVWFNCKK